MGRDVPVDEVANQDAELTDRSVRLLQKLTSRGDWRVPSDAFLDIPGRLYEYIKSIDIHNKPMQFERAVRLLAMYSFIRRAPGAQGTLSRRSL